MDAPTSFLPPLKRLDEYRAPQIHQILTRLVSLYLPKVRGTAPVDEDLESLKADDFERSFAIRWLTGFIARGEEWSELYTDGEGDLGSGAPTITSDPTIGRFQTEFLDDTSLARTTAFDRAAALLGACAGTSAAGAISREFKFATSPMPSAGHSALENENSDYSSPITISLRDESISTGDHTAVGLQTWGSACILAERIARDPVAFGLPDSSLGANSVPNVKGTRVLELGAGTGLLSLLTGKLVERTCSATGINRSNFAIVATDYHPAVLANLRANVQSNFPSSNIDDDSFIDVRPLDWSLYLTGKPTTDLSRAPSTAPTPTIGTPVNRSERNGINDKSSPSPRSATSPNTQTTLASEPTISPPIQTPFTPSFSVSSSASTPTTSYSPQTPQTPRTVRSPPPNLARAVFSRLIARGLKFEMPGGPPGLDQNSDLSKKPDSPATEDFPGQNLDPIPTYINLGPSVPSLNSDSPKTELDRSIETKEFFSASLPLGASRSELLCATLQGPTMSIESTGISILFPCLDETNVTLPSGTRDTTPNADRDPHPAAPYVHVEEQSTPIGDVGRSVSPEVSNKVRCLGTDSMIVDGAVGRETPLFKPRERADGPRRDLPLGQLPQMASSKMASITPFSKPRRPESIGYDPKIDIPGKAHSQITPGSEDVESSFNPMSSDNQNETSIMADCQAPETSTDQPFDQPFDVIFGADIVYELSHINLVRGVVECLLRKPSYRPGSPPAYFHLIMPLRPTHADEANSVDMAFPRAEDVNSNGATDNEVLAIVKTETYARSAGVGRADEVQYVHYCVGWV
ncbi:unnamed protein product [Rhizoctonia solani]|uniref:Methyltransferase domain-containing protein n=1 Tax=Rhizoctonia solani TaxID=456999 RepID=A0A8H2WNQ8_9AGAM|nr:unnamed protein product [Rhizoctonia solani]